MNRNQQIIRTSLVGIAANIFLAAFKAVAGWLAGSVAIVMDAVNNLSDALSSVITIVGTKLSEKPADRNHPFGYGRVEYFSAIIISVIVLSTGILSLVESVKKIFNPTHPSYTAVTLTIIIVAIVVKLVLGWYVKKQGDALHPCLRRHHAFRGSQPGRHTRLHHLARHHQGWYRDDRGSRRTAPRREHIQGHDAQHRAGREAVCRCARCL